MKITVQLTCQSEGRNRRWSARWRAWNADLLQPETLGLPLAEARAILAGLEQTLREQQSAAFIAQQRRCPQCGRERACKGHHQIVFRTPFGKLKLDSPQLYGCPCQSPGAKSVSPLAERLPERSSPKLTYLETKFAALVSYGLTVARPSYEAAFVKPRMSFFLIFLGWRWVCVGQPQRGTSERLPNANPRYRRVRSEAGSSAKPA